MWPRAPWYEMSALTVRSLSRIPGLALWVAAGWTPIAVNAQTAKPVRSLGPVVATAPNTISAVNQLVALSDGRVLVADAGKRVVTLLDASLAKPIVVLDSATGLQNTFTSGMNGASPGDGRGSASVSFSGGGGGRGGGPSGPPAPNFLVGFRGDSSLWFDRDASVFVVVEPSGKLGRVMAAPSQTSSGRSLLQSNGAPSSSPTVGLVYKLRTPYASSPLAPGEPDRVGVIPDSMVVVRMDYATRALDTLTKISSGSNTLVAIRSTGTTTSSGTGIGLYPFYDDVAVTTDGTMAIFHAHEYRIDWIGPKDAPLTGPKLSYPWQHITDDARQHIVDSVNSERKRGFDSSVAKRAADSARTGKGPMMTMSSQGPDGTMISRQVPDGRRDPRIT